MGLNAVVVGLGVDLESTADSDHETLLKAISEATGSINATDSAIVAERVLDPASLPESIQPGDPLYFEFHDEQASTGGLDGITESFLDAISTTLLVLNESRDTPMPALTGTPGTSGAADSFYSPTVANGFYQAASGGSDLSYDLAVGPGTYTVTLHFTELDPAVTANGDREFDILLENGEAGEQSQLDYDIFEAAGGGDTGVIVVFTVTVGTDGILDIDLIGQTGDPLLAGIEITEAP